MVMANQGLYSVDLFIPAIKDLPRATQVEEFLSSIDGVKVVFINLLQNYATVYYEIQSVSQLEIIMQLDQADYTAWEAEV